MMPLVSVLMPVWNAVATVADAVTSVLAQDFADFELVIVDDGSDDGTADALAGIADSRVRLTRIRRSGLVAALNVGLELCRGEFIARMDADDVCLSGRLLRQAAALSAAPEIGLCACRVEAFPIAEVSDNFRYYLDWQNSLLLHDEIVVNIFVEVPFTHPSVMYRASIMRRLRGYRDGGFPEDQDLWLRMWRDGIRFMKVPEVLFKWRESPGRLTRTDPRYAQTRFIGCKIEHLRETLLSGNRPFALWGIGPTGKIWARALMQNGLKPSFFVDLDPRKIGQRPYGISVIHPDDLPDDDTFVLITVGAKGAREEVRKALFSAGRREMDDFIAVQ